MRIKRFDVTVEFLRGMFGPGRRDVETVKNALPADAELVRINVEPCDSTPDVLSLFFVSTEFPDLPEGTHIESEWITFRQYRHEDDEPMKAFS